ncbi:uncharacterized protein LOC112577088 isoform X1 [Pomacea canaliculata]|uniref:uncharacterized protein LOC112577088 isoform X1 n=1 Tax=Pomacea canaliculata TaxID=400727 RepID=UPI000D7330AA|nr:uncharacterized protein LOC112577088 isoform X1 [Pomacea canaliculata]
MAMSYHMEARIKQERLDRWNRIKQMPLSDESKELSNTPEKFVPGLIEPRCTDSGQFDMRKPLPMFRVNEEGYRNRYRNRHHLAPHVDCAYSVIYPGMVMKDQREYLKTGIPQRSRDLWNLLPNLPLKQCAALNGTMFIESSIHMNSIDLFLFN